jgi:15-cis-phytoene synthase/lycopene beta-cyclase
LAYASDEARIISKQPDVQAYISENFPESARSSLRLLLTHLLPFGPLYDLLEGFKTDLQFLRQDSTNDKQSFPISTFQDLEKYAAQVAGTVAELILELVFVHSDWASTSCKREQLVAAGGEMGIALQYVNISRDIATDAAIGRVYIPTSWLKEEGLTPEQVIQNPHHPKVEILRQRLLDKAFSVYEEARIPMAQLPDNARSPMRVAVECYMEIGRVLREKGYRVKQGKATVPILRRLRVAWKALGQAS